MTAIVCTHSYISCRVREYQRDTTRRNTNTVMIRSDSYDTVLYGAKVGDVDIRISTPIASITSPPPPVKVIPHIDELSFFLSLSLSFYPFIHLTPASRTTTACILLPSPDTAQPTKMQFHTLHGSTTTTTTTQQHTNINCAPCDACIYFPAKSPPPLLVPSPHLCPCKLFYFILFCFHNYIYIFYTFHGLPSPFFFFYPHSHDTRRHTVSKEISAMRPDLGIGKGEHPKRDRCSLRPAVGGGSWMDKFRNCGLTAR